MKGCFLMKGFFSKSLSCLLSVLIVITMIPLTLRADDETNADDWVVYRPGEDMQMWYLPDGTESLVDHSGTDKKLTYYCINEYDQSANTQEQLYQRILLNTAKNLSGDASMPLLNKWANFANTLLKENTDTVNPAADSDYPFKTDDVKKRLSDLNEYTEKFTKDGYKFSIRSTGLVQTTSLHQVWEDVLTNFQKCVDRKPSNSQRDDWERFKIPPFMDDKNEQIVYYSMLASAARTKNTNKFHMDSAMLVFYDFKICDVIPDQYYVPGVTEALEKEANGEENYLNNEAKANGGVYENYTLEDNSGQMIPENGHIENKSLQTGGSNSIEYAYTDSESVTTTRTETTSHTSGGSVGASVSYSRMWGAGMGEAVKFNEGSAKSTLTVAVNGSYNWSDCLSNSTAVAENSTTTEGRTIKCSTVPLPAHTGSDCYVNLTDTTQQVDFSGPLCVTFKVAIATCSGNCYTDTVTIHDTKGYHQNCSVFKFGETKSSDLSTDSTSNMYNILFNSESSETGGEQVWNNSLTNVYKWRREPNSSNTGSETSDITINWLQTSDELQSFMRNIATYVPMVQTPLTMNVKAYHASITQGGVYPLYPLRKITSDNGGELAMGTNSEYSLNDSIQLTGYDAGESGSSVTDVAEYNGFDQRLGTWVICDEDGNELSDSPIITIQDEGNGKIKLISGTTNGDAFIKYKINEDCYHAYYEGEGAYTTNSDLSEVPIIKVSVKVGTGFTGTLKVEGDLQLTVGKAIDMTSADNTLKVYGIDSKGQQTLIPNDQINWYPIETTLQQNNPNNPYEFTPTQEGEAHIGVEYGGVQYTRGREGRTILYGYPVTISPANSEGITQTMAKISYKGNVAYGDSAESSVDEENVQYKAKSYSSDDTSQVVNWMAIDALYDVAKIFNQVNGVETTVNKSDIYEGLRHLKEIGVIDSSINVNDDLTRENFAKMCYSLAKVKSRDVSANDCIIDCADVSEVPNDSYDAINWAVSRGILQLDNNYINPNGGFTDQQFKDSLKQILQRNTNLQIVGKTSYLNEIIYMLLYVIK